MKNHSRDYVSIGISFIICSLLWFLWVENTIMGVIWLCLGLGELLLALIIKRKN